MALYLVSPFYMNLIIRHPIYHLATSSNDNVVHSGPICYTNTRDFGTFRDLLESCTYLFLRYKHCSCSTKEGENGWSLYMDDSHYVCNGTCLQHLFRARKAWSVPYFLERMLYIPLTITTILILNRVFRRTPRFFNRMLSFVGALSLEAYLIHDHFVLQYIEEQGRSYWPTFLMTTVITLPLAWLLHTSLNRLITPIEKRLK